VALERLRLWGDRKPVTQADFLEAFSPSEETGWQGSRPCLDCEGSDCPTCGGFGFLDRPHAERVWPLNLFPAQDVFSFYYGRQISQQRWELHAQRMEARREADRWRAEREALLRSYTDQQLSAGVTWLTVFERQAELDRRHGRR
jgi:hypothetical protein